MFSTLYRVLLALVLPPGFRREWGDAMRAEARLQWAEARGSARARARLVARLVMDAVATGGVEWRWTVRGRRERLQGGGGMGLDLKLAVRSLRRTPGFSASVVATLGLGIGAVALVFSLVDAFLLRTLPYPEPDRLVVVWGETHWSRAMVARGRADLASLDVVAGAGVEILVLDEGEEPMEVVAGQATAGYLDMLGARPVLGRLIVAGDEAPGAEPVTLLSYELWVDRFGGDPGVLGRSVALGGLGATRRTVVGVLPPAFTTPVGRGAEAWVPVDIDPTAADFEDSYFMTGVGRLGAGASVEGLRSEVRRWAEGLQEANPGWFSDDEVAQAGVLRLRDAVGRDRRTPLLLALAAAVLVLMVACANVANLILTRTTGRRVELSIRAALGSGRTRALRGVLAEAVLLGGVGGALGSALAWGVARAIEQRAPGLVPVGGLAPSPRVLGVAVAATALAAALAGVLPTLRAGGRDPAEALGGARGSSGDRTVLRLQATLASVQLGLALVGIASAGLLGRSLSALAAVDPGFESEGLLTFRLTAPPAAFPEDDDVLGFHLGVREALARTPGVASVGLVSRLPMGRGTSRTTVFPEGYEVPASGELPEVTHRLVTAGYLETLGARLIDGRLPGPEEDRSEGTLRGVVNRAAAERFWPDGSAVGRRFLGRGGVVWFEVVGVVDDIRELGPDAAREDPALYIPLRDWPWRTLHAVVQSRGAHDVAALKAAVWSVGAGVPVNDVRPLSGLVEDALRPARLLALLALVVGGVTLALGLLGVYGVVSYTAQRRRREIGVRAALGAGRSRLLRGELWRAGRTIGAGAVFGLVGAWGAGRALDSMLFGVAATDPGILAGSLLLLVTFGLLAAWVPARRAARADPVEALRAE